MILFSYGPIEGEPDLSLLLSDLQCAGAIIEDGSSATKATLL